MKKALILLIAVFLAQEALAQATTEVILKVENVPPMISTPNITSPLRLNPAGSTTVWCNASIRDLNGINDVVALRGVFWSGEKSNETDANDPAKHYTATYSNITPEANTRGYGTVAFAVASSAVSGLWYCKITAVDAANLTGYNTTTAMVFPVSCDNIILDAGEELIDCGGICPACFNTTPVNASGVRGKTVNASGWINYLANQPSKIVYAGASNLTITGVNKSELVAGEGVIQSNNIAVKNQNLQMPGQGNYEFPLEISIPLNSILGYYEGGITLQTDTGKVFKIPMYVKVQMPNVPPQVREVTVTYPLILSPNSSVEFNCNATVYDANGFDDVNKLDFFVAHKAQVTEDVAFLGSEFKKTSENTGYASSRFLMGASAPGGSWMCTVTAFDRLNASGSNTTTFQVYPAACSNGVLDRDEELADCGGICAPCLEGRKVRVDLKGGIEVIAETLLQSRALERLKIEEIEIRALIAEDGVIPKENITVSPRTLTLEPKGREQLRFTIDVPGGLNKSEYVGNMTASTNTTVKANITIVGDMRFRGRGYLNLEVGESCAGMRLNQSVVDEYTLEPIEAATMAVMLEGKTIETLSTDSKGRSFFIPNREGSYNITAVKGGYQNESVIAEIVLCGQTPTCDDGIINQKEEDVDCGGPCPPCSCLNGVKDQDEEGVDCGGPCVACHCSDGLYNKDERGIDCGGKDCTPCPEFNLVPKLVIKKPIQASTNDIIQIQITDDQGRMTQALLSMENPEGAAKKATTNRTGGYELNLTTAGIWKFQATKAGYLPNSASILVIEGYVYTVVGSFLMLLVFAILVFLYLKKQRSLIVADEESLKRLTIEGRLNEYRRLYMTASIIERIGETIESKKVKGIPLSQDEGLHAASIAEQYGLKPDTAELIILCRKIKAKKLITTAEIPFELRQNLRPLTITTPDEESR